MISNVEAACCLFLLNLLLRGFLWLEIISVIIRYLLFTDPKFSLIYTIDIQLFMILIDICWFILKDVRAIFFYTTFCHTFPTLINE